MAWSPSRSKLTPENPSSTKKRVLKKWCSSAYFCKIIFWFCMLSLSPACISSWLNLQYKAVILSVCNILSSFPTTDKHGICTVYIIPHTAACVMYKMWRNALFPGVCGVQFHVFANEFFYLFIQCVRCAFTCGRTYKVSNFSYFMLRCGNGRLVLRQRKSPFLSQTYNTVYE